MIQWILETCFAIGHTYRACDWQQTLVVTFLVSSRRVAIKVES